MGSIISQIRTRVAVDSISFKNYKKAYTTVVTISIKFMPPTTPVPPAPMSGAPENNGLAYVAYLVFFIPLIMGNMSPFVKYHTNQGTVLFLASIIGSFIVMFIGWIPLIGWAIAIAFLFFIVACLIIGLLNVSKNEMKPLPLIGGITLIK